MKFLKLLEYCILMRKRKEEELSLFHKYTITNNFGNCVIYQYSIFIDKSYVSHE